jgi:hypothetical protein
MPGRAAEDAAGFEAFTRADNTLDKTMRRGWTDE